MFAKSFFLALPSLLDSRAGHIRLLRWRTIQVLGIKLDRIEAAARGRKKGSSRAVVFVYSRESDHEPELVATLAASIVICSNECVPYVRRVFAYGRRMPALDDLCSKATLYEQEQKLTSAGALRAPSSEDVRSELDAAKEQQQQQQQQLTTMMLKSLAWRRYLTARSSNEKKNRRIIAYKKGVVCARGRGRRPTLDIAAAAIPSRVPLRVYITLSENKGSELCLCACGRYQRRLLDSMLSRVPQISSRATNKKYRTMTRAREQPSHLKIVNREISSRARELAFIARQIETSTLILQATARDGDEPARNDERNGATVYTLTRHNRFCVNVYTSPTANQEESNEDCVDQDLQIRELRLSRHRCCCAQPPRVHTYTYVFKTARRKSAVYTEQDFTRAICRGKKRLKITNKRWSRSLSRAEQEDKSSPEYYCCPRVLSI
ncbi:unnamed protein product [Trichogramma brassicae]|uniref:Uncharacterized protein n=1 Tax=Trichogramma brassicae TaxID=86971 RepID=A0A6H5I738_9HYME|nr:unnamed protein product [Trichogramma brassicae]